MNIGSLHSIGQKIGLDFSYFWPFEAVEVEGGHMVKKQNFGPKKTLYICIYPSHGHFIATNGSKSSKGH